jgi:hypothetical protein
MIISAANCLENNKAAVNSLNVFPVPDGDTGTNMSMTMVSAVKEVQKIVATIHLTPKDPCNCPPHSHQAIFQKPSEQIEISFCDHCFDVLGAQKNGKYQNVQGYSMPKEFYSEFRKIISSRTNEHWELSGTP